jgi:SAM-dependent methyltransferase
MTYASLARHYDCFTQNMDYKKRTEYLCALLCRAEAAHGAGLLDLACGTGIYTYALLERGYDVTGVDASVDMLGVALEKATEKGIAPPLLLCQRLEQLDLYGTYQAAVCLTDSVNHLTTPAQVRCFFRRLALFLEPGAPFIFDVNTIHKHEQVLADNCFVYESDGVFCAWQNHWEPESQTTRIQLDVFGLENGVYLRDSECFCERAYAPEDLTAWLRKAGFAVLHIYGELTEQPPEADAARVVFVCRRR